MAGKIQVKLILLLRSTGMSQRAICQSRHMSRNSVSEVFRISDEQNITYADVYKSPPLDHVHGRNRPPSRSGRPVHITAKTPW